MERQKNYHARNRDVPLCPDYQNGIDQTDSGISTEVQHSADQIVNTMLSTTSVAQSHNVTIGLCSGKGSDISVDQAHQPSIGPANKHNALPNINELLYDE